MSLPTCDGGLALTKLSDSITIVEKTSPVNFLHPRFKRRALLAHGEDCWDGLGTTGSCWLVAGTTGSCCLVGGTPGSCWLVVVFSGSYWLVASTDGVVLARVGHC